MTKYIRDGRMRQKVGTDGPLDDADLTLSHLLLLDVDIIRYCGYSIFVQNFLYTIFASVLETGNIDLRLVPSITKAPATV